MKRHIQGLREMASNGESDLPDGIYPVRVDRAQYRWNGQNPFYALRLSVLEPQELSGCVVSGRLFCSACAVWKLGWFLRDFPLRPRTALPG